MKITNQLKHDKIILSAKNKLNTIGAFIYKGFIDSYINHGKFASVNVLREYNGMEKETKNPKNTVNIPYKSNGSPLCQL